MGKKVQECDTIIQKWAKFYISQLFQWARMFNSIKLPYFLTHSLQYVTHIKGKEAQKCVQHNLNHSTLKNCFSPADFLCFPLL